MAEYKAPVLWMAVIGLVALAPLVYVPRAKPDPTYMPSPTGRKKYLAQMSLARIMLSPDFLCEPQVADAMVVLARRRGLPRSLLLDDVADPQLLGVAVQDRLTGREFASIVWNEAINHYPLFHLSMEADTGDLSKNQLASLSEKFFKDHRVMFRLTTACMIEWRRIGNDVEFVLSSQPGKSNLSRIAIRVDIATGTVTSQSVTAPPGGLPDHYPHVCISEAGA